MTIERHIRVSLITPHFVSQDKCSPDCVDSAQPWPFLLPAACTCSDDFETKFSPEVKERKENHYSVSN